MHRKPFSYTEAMQGKTKKIQKQQNNSLSCFSSSAGISLPNEDVLFLFGEIKILKIRKFPLKVHYSEPQQFLHFIFSFSHLSSDLHSFCSVLLPRICWIHFTEEKIASQTIALKPQKYCLCLQFVDPANNHCAWLPLGTGQALFCFILFVISTLIKLPV